MEFCPFCKRLSLTRHFTYNARMKTTKWFEAVLVGGLLVCGGCKPKAPQVPPQVATMQSLQQAFASGTPEQQAAIQNAYMGIRYGQYVNTLSALDKLSSDPSITETQKTLINNMIEQLKATMATNPPAR